MPSHPKFRSPRPGKVQLPHGLTILGRQLRDERLIPVVAVLAIGLIAIPVLLSGSSERETPTEGAAPGPTASASGKPPALVVQRWAPGLLRYTHRLTNRRPTDPFESDESFAAAEGNLPGSSGSPEEFEAIPYEPAPEESSGEELRESRGPGVTGPSGDSENPSGSGQPSDQPGSATQQAEAIDVKVTPVHAPGTEQPKNIGYIGHRLPQLTKLPNESVPAFTYIGVSPDGQKALMSVSPEIVALLGASKCVSGGNPCQVLALEIGSPETLVFGPRGLTYRIELLKVGLEPTSLGAPAPAVGQALAVQR